MKKLIIAVFLIQVMVIGFWGLTASNVFADAISVDKETGLVIKQDTPDNLIYSYYELLGLEQFEKVRTLMTPISRQSIDAKSMAKVIRRTQLTNVKVEKIFPSAVNNDLAVVGYIRSADITNEKAFLVGLAVVKANNRRWEKVEITDELDMNQIETVLKLAIKVEGEMLATEKNDFGISNLDSRHKEMILSQVSSMEVSHKQSLAQLLEYKNNLQQNPQQPE